MMMCLSGFEILILNYFKIFKMTARNRKFEKFSPDIVSL